MTREVHVLEPVDALARPARRVRIEWPSGATTERIQLAGPDGFDEVDG